MPQKVVDIFSTIFGLLNPLNTLIGIGAIAIAVFQGRWNDIAIDWKNGCFNPFNQSEKIALESNVFSFYKERIELENISSNVTFKLFFYITKSGTKNGSPYFGNEPGIILFEESLWTIIVDGEGSIFPIYEIEDVNAPLWSYICDVDDVSEDNFDDDHISIIINRKHPLYECVHPKSTAYNSLVLNEMMSSAVSNIIMTIRKP